MIIDYADLYFVIGLFVTFAFLVATPTNSPKISIFQIVFVILSWPALFVVGFINNV